MAELQQNRYDQLIRRVGGIIGPGSMVSEAITELFPFIDVETNKGELLALSGVGICWGRVLSPAVAGENARCQLFNPADSGKLITVTQLAFQGGTTDNIEIGTLGVALASLSAVARFRDTRFGTALVPVAQLRSDSNIGATPATYRLVAPSGAFENLTDENSVAVLSPGFGLVVSATTVNIALTSSYIWRERVAEPSELNL